MKLPKFYDKGTSFHPRTETDKLFQLETGSIKMQGALDEATRFIEQEQLLDARIWSIFVQQFRENLDDQDLGWRGEFWGKLMRGAVFIYQYTKNAELYSLIEETVRDLLTTQDEQGRFSTYSPEKEFQQWDMWSRKYILLGLQYFLDICENEPLTRDCIAAMCRHADYILGKVGQGEGKIPVTKTSTFWGGLNSSSILEPFVRLYSITGEQRYLDFAAEIIEEGAAESFHLFDTAFEGRLYPYQYPETKAYEMISCFEGLLEYYRITGEEKHKTAALNFASLVMDSDITMIGSSGCTHELFDNSRIQQFNPLMTDIMQETCVTVTWMKYCHQLLSLTGEPTYADHLEISAQNALLGAVNKERNTTFSQSLPFDSYSPLLISHRGKSVGGMKTIEGKEFYGCCAAIGAAGLGVYMNSAVMSHEKGLAVNFYTEGWVKTETPDGQDLTLDMLTDYPADGKIKIEIDLKKPEIFTLLLRIPHWSEDTELSVNGESMPAEKGAYAKLKREWTSGDVIEISLNMAVRVIHAAALDNRNESTDTAYFALQKGPIVMTRDSEIEGKDIEKPLHIREEVQELEATETHIVTPLPTRQQYKISLPSGDSFTVVDYASAGRSWNPKKPVTVWLPSKP